MSMKKIAFCLAVLTLLSALASCGRRQDILNQIESEKAAESAAVESNVVTMGGGRETIAPSPDTQSPDNPVETSNPDNPPESYKPPVPTVPDPNDKYPNNAGYQFTDGINKGGDGYYKGMTAESLQKRYDSGKIVWNSSEHYNTPLGIFFIVPGEQSTYYNKLTGNVTHVCPDPLCKHDECVWGKLMTLQYVTDTHLYFTAGDFYSGTYLYRSDLNRNHVEPLEIPLDTGEQVCYVDGDKVYVERLVYKAEEAGDYTYGVLDCKSKEYTTLYDDESVHILAVTGGSTVWFWLKNDDTVIWKSDLNLEHMEKAFEGSAMSILQSTKDYLLLGEENGTFVGSCLYHIPSGKTTDIRGLVSTSTLATVDGQYIYYTKDITEEEIAISPLKNYYRYELVYGDNKVYRGGLFGGDGRVYRMNLETGEEEMCAELSYNGVPLRITNVVADGDAIYVAYLTYNDWNNYYNQSYNPEKPYRQEPPKYMYVDMTNGTVNLLNPYQIG